MTLKDAPVCSMTESEHTVYTPTSLMYLQDSLPLHTPSASYPLPLFGSSRGSPSPYGAVSLAVWPEVCPIKNVATTILIRAQTAHNK